MSLPLEIRSEFRLRRFTSALDLEFVEALRIYGESTKPDIRSSTNDFVYWIERYAKRFPGDQVLFLGFYAKKKIIGFVLATYLSRTKLLVIDHVAIANDFRKNDAFFVLVEQIKMYVRAIDLDIRYVVAEVDAYEKGTSARTDGYRMLRLLKLLGFGVAKALYYQLPLGDVESMAEQRLALMVRPYADGALDQLSRKEYLDIVHTLYFDHYVRWYKDLLADPAAYETRAVELYQQVESSVRKVPTIIVNGFQADQLLTGGAPTAGTPMELLKFLVPTVGLVMAVIAFIAGLVLGVGLDPLTAGVIVILGLLIVVIVASLVSPTAREALQGLLNSLKVVFGRGA